MSSSRNPKPVRLMSVWKAMHSKYKIAEDLYYQCLLARNRLLYKTETSDHTGKIGFNVGVEVDGP